MYRNNYNPLKTKPGINLTSLVLRKEGSLRRVSRSIYIIGAYIILAIYFGFENIMNILSYMKDVKNLLFLK